MFAISPGATHAIVRSSRLQDGVGEDAGVRITHGPARGERIDLAMEVGPGPQADDRVVVEEGARAFLPPGTATLLEDELREAQVDGRRLMGFAILEQGREGHLAPRRAGGAPPGRGP